MKLKPIVTLALPLLVALSSRVGLADPVSTPPTTQSAAPSNAPGDNSNAANAPQTAPAPATPGAAPVEQAPTPIPPAQRLVPMGMASMFAAPSSGAKSNRSAAAGNVMAASSPNSAPIFPPAAEAPSYAPVSRAVKRNYALMWAAYDGATSRVRDLLAAGASIEARDWKYGFTPLLWASENGRLGTVRYLLSKGAKPNVKSAVGVPVMLAVGDFKLTSTTAETSAYSNGLDVIALALYVQARQGGVTPLVMASAQGYGLTVRALLDKGASPNLGTTDNITPLICAAFNGYMPSIRALLDKGAKLDGTDAYYDYPLSMAAGQGNTALVRFLLARGSNPNLIPSPGIVSNFALKYGHVATARVVRQAEIKRFAADAARSKAQTSMVGDEPTQITPDANANDMGIILLR